MKKVYFIAFLMGCMLALGGCGLSHSNSEEVEEVIVPVPTTAQMQNICELATMECYYHNVAKYEEEDAEGFLFWKKDKRFWVEYSGTVKVGIDASLVSMEVEDDVVTITIPEAKVLSTSVDAASLTEESFIIDYDSAKPTAEDTTLAIREAQSYMEDYAKHDRTLLNNSKQRAKDLLENYVKNMGEETGIDYQIKWVEIKDPSEVTQK